MKLAWNHTDDVTAGLMLWSVLADGTAGRYFASLQNVGRKLRKNVELGKIVVVVASW